MIICLGTTPAVQRVMRFANLQPDHVNRATGVWEGAAGKFVNVGKVLRQIGEDAFVLGFSGGARGKFLGDELLRLGVRCQFLEVRAETRLCTTIIDEAGGTVTELVEESAPAAEADFNALLTALKQHIRRAGALVLSGTVAQGGPADFYAQCSTIASRAGVLCVVDAQGQSLLNTLPTRPAVVKPNKSELEKTVGHSLPDENSTFEAMKELMARGAGSVVVTQGPKPVLAVNAQGKWKVSCPKINAVNPIGSGDAFTAGLAAGLTMGKNLGEACAWGAAAGSANALTLMPGELNKDEYDRLLTQVRVEALA